MYSDISHQNVLLPCFQATILSAFFLLYLKNHLLKKSLHFKKMVVQNLKFKIAFYQKKLYLFQKYQLPPRYLEMTLFLKQQFSFSHRNTEKKRKTRNTVVVALRIPFQEIQLFSPKVMTTSEKQLKTDN